MPIDMILLFVFAGIISLSAIFQGAQMVQEQREKKRQNQHPYVLQGYFILSVMVVSQLIVFYLVIQLLNYVGFLAYIINNEAYVSLAILAGLLFLLKEIVAYTSTWGATSLTIKLKENTVKKDYEADSVEELIRKQAENRED